MENRTHGGQESRQPKKGVEERNQEESSLGVASTKNRQSRTDFEWLMWEVEEHQKESREAKQGRKEANEVRLISKLLLWATGT